MPTFKNLLVAALCMVCSFCAAQPQNKIAATDSLSGYITLNIDVSKLTDTAGVFKVRIGGETFFPKVENGKLHVQYKMDEPRRAYFIFYPRDSVEAIPGRSTDRIVARYTDYYTFFAHPGSFNIDGRDMLRNTAIVNASTWQHDYAKLEAQLQDFQNSYWKPHADLYTQLHAATGAKADSLRAIVQTFAMQAYRKYYNDVVLWYVKTHPDSPTALQQLDDYQYSNFVDFDAIASLYNNFTARIKALPTAKRLYRAIDTHQFQEMLVGKPAPNFTIKNTEGKEVSLGDYKGSITLLEFWASWCGPCRANNPALLQTYNKYKAKGLKILGVSLDSKKDDWLAAIKTDGLVWDHASDLKFWDGPVSKLYHVSGVPTNYLIGKDGKVLAKDLDDDELNKQLAILMP